MVKKAQGRPSIYTQELADKICHELALGKSLRTVCKTDGMPDISTIFEWFRTKEGFTKQYEKAKQEASDALAEEILDISDESSGDYIEVVDKDGNVRTRLNQENIQRARLRVDTRKWLMSKMKPKKYGEQVDVTSGGETIKGNTIIIKDFSNGADNQS